MVVLQSHVVVPGSLLVVVVPQFGGLFICWEQLVHVQSPSADPQNVGYRQLHGGGAAVVVVVVVVEVVLVVVVNAEQSPPQTKYGGQENSLQPSASSSRQGVLNRVPAGTSHGKQALVMSQPHFAPLQVFATAAQLVPSNSQTHVQAGVGVVVVVDVVVEVLLVEVVEVLVVVVVTGEPQLLIAGDQVFDAADQIILQSPRQFMGEGVVVVCGFGVVVGAGVVVVVVVVVTHDSTI